MVFQWSMLINAGSNFWHWQQCRSINQCQSMMFNANEAASDPPLIGIDPHWSALICIERYWSLLIFIDRHWSLLRYILDQCQKFDPALIGSDRHWSLIQHVLSKGYGALCIWKGLHSLYSFSVTLDQLEFIPCDHRRKHLIVIARCSRLDCDVVDQRHSPSNSIL